MKSMTGYGITEITYKKRTLSLEMKTVNHRFCEINLRLPSRFYPLEAELSEFTKKSFNRGRIDIFIRENGGNVRGQARVDESQLKTYLKIIKELNKTLKHKDPPRPEALLTLPQVVVLEDDPEDLKEALQAFKKGLLQVFKKVDQMREKEGETIKKEFHKHLDELSTCLKRVEEKVPEIVAEYQVRLKERIEKLTQQSPDEWRLAQEVAHFVDRTDVSEEIQRLKSHLGHFRDVLQENEPVGRKLDFILQEMNREINTLGSKAQDSQVSKWVVACKHELEKMREQVQNVE